MSDVDMKLVLRIRAFLGIGINDIVKSLWATENDPHKAIYLCQLTGLAIARYKLVDGVKIPATYQDLVDEANAYKGKYDIYNKESDL